MDSNLRQWRQDIFLPDWAEKRKKENTNTRIY